MARACAEPEMIEPEVALILVFDNPQLPQEEALETARDILKRLNSSYAHISIIFREKSRFFLLSKVKSYGVIAYSDRLEDLSEAAISEALGNVEAVERLRQEAEHRHNP
ncbi:MAG: hypothetical protein R2880_11975 [Deinococcales bacterium]